MTDAASSPATSPDGPVEIASAYDTRMALLEQSRRSATPVGNAFVQNPTRGLADRSAPLASFVRRGDKRGLLALLVLHGAISSGDHENGWSASYPLPVWARAFDTTKNAELTSASTAASKVIKRLVDQQLILRTSGKKRWVKLTLLQPDGSGAPYERPKSGFLQLPHTFWSDRWDEKLSLAAIAMLLVALHEKPEFELATERMRAWYGFSPDTAERGFAELRDHGLISWRKRGKKAPLAPEGITYVNVYKLTGTFSRSGPTTLTAEMLADSFSTTPRPQGDAS